VETNIKELKWRKFLNRAGLFRFIPFADFMLAAGSLAMGNVHEHSDFDVIMGAKPGRIFTVRFFSVLIFGLFGWRRNKSSCGKSASDKICLNHFVTPSNYRLRSPYNAYWQKLYGNLVPIAGDKGKINDFFSANDWLDKKREYVDIDERHIIFDKSLFARVAERVLSSRFGDFVEKKMKNWQIKRIEAGLKSGLGYKPRVFYGSEELEFHPDTKRIEDMLKSGL
jgi:hypothetical protein